MRPMIYMIGSAALEHGERGVELDAEHPEACLCGFENYMLCPHADEGISSWTIYPKAPKDFHETQGRAWGGNL